MKRSGSFIQPSTLLRQAGFTLLELLLVVGIGGVALIGFSDMAQDWRENSRKTAIARHLSTVHEAAESYVLANFADIWSLPAGFSENISDVNGDGVVNQDDGLNSPLPHIFLPLEDDGTSPWYLKDSTGALPASYPARNGLNQPVRVIVREAGYVQGRRAIDIITIAMADLADPSSRQTPDKDLGDIARLVGEKGGVFSAVNVSGDVCINGAIVGVFGGWRFDASTLDGGALCTDTLPPVVGAGGYVAVVGTVFYEDLMNSDVLYKVSIPGRPELNRMEADLNMSALDIQNVRYLTADNLRVAGNLVAPKATVTVDGILRSQGNQNVVTVALDGVGEDPCVFTDPWSETATLNPAAAGPCKASGGYMIINGRDLTGGVASLNMENIVLPGTNSNPLAQNTTIAGELVSENYGSNTVLASAVQTNTLTGTKAMSISTNSLSLSGTASVGYLEMTADPGTYHTIDSFSADDLQVAALQTSLADINELETNTLEISGKILVGGMIPSYEVESIESCTSTVAYDEDDKLVTVASYDCTPEEE
jgi:prepilin-type N-terminal cleavage/methylation domain-containing protein